jgi:hypothetical protein
LTVANILLVEMAAKKRAADAASDRADGATKHRMTNKSAADAACDRSYGTVAAAAAMA